MIISSDHKAAYDRDGFVVIEDAFAPDEIAMLQRQVDVDDRVKDAGIMADKDGRASKLSISSEINDDVWGHVTRMPRVVRGVEALLGEEVYHWHSKIMIKEPREGGAWEWHQDYGYWYHDDPPFPLLISAMVAVTDADAENGCLKVLKGSHSCGRIEHGKAGHQAGANPDRVAALTERLSTVDCELKSGSLLFFHCNLLHCSSANLSERRRISYICCYNAMSNPPLTKVGHGTHEPIALVEDAVTAWTA